MADIVTSLSELARDLDKAGLKDFSSKVRKAQHQTRWIKQAQYQGAQGYWMRNSRCWHNCYRQKRAEKPESPTQIIWEECQKEYVASINDDNSGWEKYAGNEKTIKTAQNSNILKHEEEIFRYAVSQNLKNGLPFANSVHEALQDGHERYSVALIDNASELLTIAESLQTSGHTELSVKATSIANDLVKESQLGKARGFLGNIKDRFNKVFNKAKYIVQRLKTVVNNLQMLRNQVPQGGFRLNPQKDAWSKRYIETMQELIKEKENLQSVSSQGGMFGNQQALALFNQSLIGLDKATTEFKNTNKGIFRSQLLDVIIRDLNKVITTFETAANNQANAPQQAVQSTTPQVAAKTPKLTVQSVQEMNINDLFTAISQNPQLIQHFKTTLSRAAKTSNETIKVADTLGQIVDAINKRLRSNPSEMTAFKQRLGIAVNANPVGAAEKATTPQVRGVRGIFKDPAFMDEFVKILEGKIAIKTIEKIKNILTQVPQTNKPNMSDPIVAAPQTNSVPGNFSAPDTGNIGEGWATPGMPVAAKYVSTNKYATTKFMRKIKGFSTTKC